jgi:putative ABC transport system permease protein
MPLPTKIASLFRSLFHKERLDRELDAELRAYLDMLTEEKIKAGLTPQQARRQARLELGGMEQVKMKVREVRFGTTLETVWQDVRYGLRMLRKNPGFTTVAVLTLALGIGANTAIFSVVNAVLLRPLPYPEPENLVLVCETNPDHPRNWCGGSPGNLWDWRRQSQTLETIGLGRSWRFGLKNAEGKFEGVAGGVATTGMFEALRVRPVLGRLFQRGDHNPGRDHVAIISHKLWQSRFGGDADIVGQSINLDEETYTVVGVLPVRFEVSYLEWVDLWIPLWSERAEWRFWRGFRPYARLAPGRTLEEARAEMKIIATRLSEQYPETNTEWGIAVDRLHDRMVLSVRPALLVFLGAVGFVLLIACANTANVMLARATGRERELAIRAALGADRTRTVRFLLTESLILASLGGGAGVLLALWMVDLFVAMAPSGFPRLEEVGVDGRALGFTLLLSVVTSVLFGLFPAWHASRVNLNTVLKEGRQSRGGRDSQRARSGLVVAEVALALVLLTGAGLLIRSFVTLTDWQPGFDTNNLVTFSVFPPLGKYKGNSQLAALYRQINREVSALPGVVSVGEVSAGPLFGGGDGVSEFYVEGRPIPPEGKLPVVAWFDCGPDYFRTMGIPLERGRFFTYADTQSTPLVAIINETMARRHWPGEDPIGQQVHLRLIKSTFEIVGVVGDVQPFDPRQPVEPKIYWPLEQGMRGATFYAVRTATDPTGMIPSIRARLEEVEPEMSVSSVATLDQHIARKLVRPKFQMTLLGIFSGIAFAIAMMGIYGVISYSVSQRTHEIGIRMALGAQPGDILKMVVGQGMLLVIVGVGIGLMGAFALTRFLESLLFGVAPTDPATFAAVAAVLAAVALLACYLPARRATKVDPMVALRYE